MVSCVAYISLRFIFACLGERGPGQGAGAAGRDVQSSLGVRQLKLLHQGSGSGRHSAC